MKKLEKNKKTEEEIKQHEGKLSKTREDYSEKNIYIMN